MKQPERAKIVAGKYALEKAIGQGAMGEVWIVRHVHNGRRFAMKLLRESVLGSAEMRGRFEREARLAAGLASPHVAQVTDSGVDEDGDPYTVLELLDGEDLQKRLKREGRLPTATVVRLATQIGKGLRVAHAAGLVHRDLKPANIFLAKQDDEEIVKVLDFGIAKSIAADMTEYTATGAMLGTASYMSPEHVRNAKTVDHRADLWAFAVVLYRALTGDVPFPLSGIELYLALGRDPIPQCIKATSVVPGLPPAVDVFFERAFSADIERRYPSATAMVEGFCRAVDGALPASEPAPRAMTVPMEDRPSGLVPLPAGLSGSAHGAASASLAGASSSGSGPQSAPASSGDAARNNARLTLGGTLKLEDTPPPDGAPPLIQSPFRLPAPTRALAHTVPDVQAQARALEAQLARGAPVAPTLPEGPSPPSRKVLWIVVAALAVLVIVTAALLLRS